MDSFVCCLEWASDGVWCFFRWDIFTVILIFYDTQMHTKSWMNWAYCEAGFCYFSFEEIDAKPKITMQLDEEDESSYSHQC